MNIKIVFANILGGREFLGTVYGEINFGDYVIDQYIEKIALHEPDLLSLAEVHLEDESHSEMVTYIAKKLGLPYYDFMGSDKSHLAEGKILGNAILSKYPITGNDHFIVEAPHIEVDRPNGDHWVLHDKLAQTSNIQIGEKIIAFTSLHYFPFHHFNRKMDDPEFAQQRQKLVSHLTTIDESVLPIITGDFNNKNLTLVNAFPELFKTGFSEAVEVASSIVGDNQQLDHILYRKADATVEKAGILEIPSDHVGLVASIRIN
jgi:endonuclease/exonuclease/phosphatase family metal-dependent hydrolase